MSWRDPPVLLLANPQAPLRLRRSDQTSIYVDRYRGTNTNISRWIFLAGASSCGDCWHMEPPQYVSTPSELRARLEADPLTRITAPLIGGSLEPLKLNLTIMETDDNEAQEIIVRAFATRHSSESQILSRYGTARILIAGVTTKWGTVKELVERYGHDLPH